MTRVAVVIPTRDRWDLLRQTVRSALEQEGVDVEVVVVDDGSRSTPPECPELSDARVRIVRNHHSLGVAAARNVGLGSATSPWVAFLDDDDLWAPSKLRSQLDAIATTDGAAWSCVGEVHVDAALVPIGYDRPPSSGDVATALLTTNCIPGGGSGVTASTDVVRSVGGFDEALRNLADYDLWIRLALAAPLASVDQPLLAYRVHAGGLSRQLDDVDDEYAYVVAKHRRVAEDRGVAPVPYVYFWAADRLERSGRRAAALRYYWRAFLRVDARASLRRMSMLPVPGVTTRRDRRRATTVPAPWNRTDLAWLDRARSAGSTGRDNSR